MNERLLNECDLNDDIFLEVMKRLDCIKLKTPYLDIKEDYELVEFTTRLSKLEDLSDLTREFFGSNKRQQLRVSYMYFYDTRRMEVLGKDRKIVFKLDKALSSCSISSYELSNGDWQEGQMIVPVSDAVVFAQVGLH